MKHEKWAVLFTAAVLAFFTAWGALGCLMTAFDLPLEYRNGPVLVCAAAAFLAAALFSVRRGGGILLCLLALAAGYIHQDGRAAEQFLHLLCRLTTIYDRAYGMGVLQLTDVPWDAGVADWPLGILGVLIAVSVSRSIVCRTSVWLPVLATLLPLGSCIVVTDTVPEERWLLMVMASLILLIITSEVRRENTAQGVRLTAAASIPVVLALTALFLAAPQESYVNQSEVLRENILITLQNIPKLMETGMYQVASGLQASPARQVNLAGLGERIPFTYPVMEVTAGKNGILYLREQDYDLYDGLAWTSTEHREEPFPGTTGQGETIIISTHHHKEILYLPYHPAPETVLREGCAENTERKTEYTVLRNALPENWRQLAYGNAVQSQEWQQYLALPEQTRLGAANFLSGQFSETASNTEKADLIAALVTDCARYDLDPDRMPSSKPDFALWFLREAEAGYCIHFATAAAVLLRSAGVPARYVTGYMVETKADQPVTVTEENAHAWAEYYEPNLRLWLPLEATPAEPVPEQIPETPPEETTRPVQTQPEETQAVTEPELPEETAPPQSVPIPDSSAAEPEEPRPVSAVLLLLPAAALVFGVQRSVRLGLRRRRLRSGDPNRQALYRWREAVRLSRLLKESPTEELIVLAQKAKFSQHQLTQEELNQFDSFLRSCLRRLREKPWYLRLIYRFVYAAY